MNQNTSNAVMATRVEPKDSLDWFATPPWGTRALCHHIIAGETMGSVWEPAAGDGAMARPLSEYFERVVASDVHDYGEGYHQHDFLQPYVPEWVGDVSWIITNPPFKLSEEFIARGLQIATAGVAVFVRSVFIESTGRYERLFSTNPPTIMAQFSERVPLNKGRARKDATTATAYCWLVWLKGVHGDTRLTWVPPCRKKLERDGDYEVT